MNIIGVTGNYTGTFRFASGRGSVTSRSFTASPSSSFYGLSKVLLYLYATREVSSNYTLCEGGVVFTNGSIDRGVSGIGYYRSSTYYPNGYIPLGTSYINSSGNIIVYIDSSDSHTFDTSINYSFVVLGC